MTSKIDFSLLSRYRSELMGLSILGIMMAHILGGWMELQNHVLIKFVDVFSQKVLKNDYAELYEN